jgi:hypothetical protein
METRAELKSEKPTQDVIISEGRIAKPESWKPTAPSLSIKINQEKKQHDSKSTDNISSLTAEVHFQKDKEEKSRTFLIPLGEIRNNSSESEDRATQMFREEYWDYCKDVLKKDIAFDGSSVAFLVERTQTCITSRPTGYIPSLAKKNINRLFQDPQDRAEEERSRKVCAYCTIEITTHRLLVVGVLDGETPLWHTLSLQPSKKAMTYVHYDEYFRSTPHFLLDENPNAKFSLKYFWRDTNRIFIFDGTTNFIVNITPDGLSLEKFSSHLYIKYETNNRLHISFDGRHIAQQELADFAVSGGLTIYEKKGNGFELVLKRDGNYLCQFALRFFIFTLSTWDLRLITSIDLETNKIYEVSTAFGPFNKELFLTDDKGNLQFESWEKNNAFTCTLKSIQDKTKSAEQELEQSPLFLDFLLMVLRSLSLDLVKLIYSYKPFSAKQMLFSPQKGLNLFNFLHRLPAEEREKWLNFCVINSATKMAIQTSLDASKAKKEAQEQQVAFHVSDAPGCSLHY